MRSLMKAWPVLLWIGVPPGGLDHFEKVPPAGGAAVGRLEVLLFGAAQANVHVVEAASLGPRATASASVPLDRRMSRPSTTVSPCSSALMA